MGTVVRFVSPREVVLAHEADARLLPGQVRLETLYSGISAGTELTAYRGLNPYLNSTWDAERRLFVPGGSTMSYPIDGFGYEEVGAVVESSGEIGGLSIGDIVWGHWGHRATTVMGSAEALRCRLAPGTPPVWGIFSQIGAIALNVVLDADIHVSETVVVFGLGVPGQLVAQLARLNGARVIGVDPDPRRRDLARSLGTDVVLDSAAGEIGEQVRALTVGMGADVAIEVSGNHRALHEAIRCAAYNSRVVVSGFFQGDSVGLRLGEEAHHNRPQLVISQIGGTAPHLQHRWNEHRLQNAFMDLVAAGRVNVDSLISHVMPVSSAADAFHLLDTTPSHALQVVLDFTGGES